MVKWLWKLLPNDGVRIVAATAVALIVMIVLAYRFISKVYKYKYDRKIVHWLAIIASVLLFGMEIIAAYIFANKYWYHLTLAQYFDNQYDLFILILMMIVTTYTVNKIVHLILEVIWELINWSSSSKMEYIYNIFQIFCLVALTRLELNKMRSIYNNENGGYDKVYLMCAACVFLGINSLLAYGFKKVKKTRHFEKENAIMRVQNQLQLEKYMALNNKYEESGRIIHDIRKHLDILDSLMVKDDDKAREYGSKISEQISQQMNLLSAGFSCSNSILSVIMSQKITEAEARHIKVDIDMMDVELDFIEDIDITAIFANMWDNAIEASIKMNEDDRWVNVVVGRMMDFIVISIENSFDGNVKTDGVNLLSSKGASHGFGLKIIETAVKKYNGQFKTEADGQMFKSRVILPVNVLR